MNKEIEIEIDNFTKRLNKEIKKDVEEFVSNIKTTNIEKLVENIQWQIEEYYKSVKGYLNYSKENEFKIDSIMSEAKLQSIKFFDELLIENLQGYKSVFKKE